MIFSSYFIKLLERTFLNEFIRFSKCIGQSSIFKYGFDRFDCDYKLQILIYKSNKCKCRKCNTATLYQKMPTSIGIISLIFIVRYQKR